MKRLFTLILITLFSCLIQASDLQGSKIKGLNFSYIEVEKNCSAKREGRDSLSIKCDGSNLKSVMRSCSGFLNGGLESAKLNCGGALWVLNQRCRIEMRGADHGDINCNI